jgi:hypothetical protein
VIVQADSAAIAAVGVVALLIGGITARRTGRLVVGITRSGAVASVRVRTVVVILTAARRTGRLVVGITRAGAVAGIRIGAVVVILIAARRSGRRPHRVTRPGAVALVPSVTLSGGRVPAMGALRERVMIDGAVRVADVVSAIVSVVYQDRIAGVRIAAMRLRIIVRRMRAYPGTDVARVIRTLVAVVTVIR